MASYLNLLTEEQSAKLPQHLLKMWVYTYQKAEAESDHILREVAQFIGNGLNHQAKLILDQDGLSAISDDLLREIQKLEEEFGEFE